MLQKYFALVFQGATSRKNSLTLARSAPSRRNKFTTSPQSGRPREGVACKVPGKAYTLTFCKPTKTIQTAMRLRYSRNIRPTSRSSSNAKKKARLAAGIGSTKLLGASWSLPAIARRQRVTQAPFHSLNPSNNAKNEYCEQRRRKKWDHGTTDDSSVIPSCCPPQYCNCNRVGTVCPTWTHYRRSSASLQQGGSQDKFNNRGRSSLPETGDRHKYPSSDQHSLTCPHPLSARPRR